MLAEGVGTYIPNTSVGLCWSCGHVFRGKRVINDRTVALDSLVFFGLFTATASSGVSVYQVRRCRTAAICCEKRQKKRKMGMGEGGGGATWHENTLKSTRISAIGRC